MAEHSLDHVSIYSCRGYWLQGITVALLTYSSISSSTGCVNASLRAGFAVSFCLFLDAFGGLVVVMS